VIGEGMVSTTCQPNDRTQSATLSMGSGGFVEELNLGELFAFCLGKIVIALYLEP
jgi:hypothetical protein